MGISTRTSVFEIFLKMKKIDVLMLGVKSGESKKNGAMRLRLTVYNRELRLFFV